MYFPQGKEDALDQIRKYTNGPVTRELAECALDFFIMIEPNPVEDYDVKMAEALDKFKAENDKAGFILRTMANQTKSFDQLQDLFYSFSNSAKYRYSMETISVVRASLNEAFKGIHGWADC